MRLLYVAPERFASPGFLERIREARIGLFVVDEAHCVSQWGHDFRPEYFRLADAARWLGAEAIVASTATATPEVARDIVARLGLREPVHVATGFDRPNLSFSRRPVREQGGRPPADRRGAGAEPEALPAIVYAGTRAESDRLSERLGRELGVEVVAYHAGLPRDARADAQRRFMDGSAPVVVATNAFGMGVDKADVRTVCHESVPSSIEAYYQEAGRAGRDGAPARCLLFATGRDKGLHVFFIERSAVDEDQLQGRRAQDRALGRGSPPRYSLHINELARGDGRGGGRARDRRLHGPRGRHPAGAVGARPRRRPRRRARGTAASLAVCRAAAQEGTRSAGASTARSGPGSRARLPARGHPAPLRRPLGARADRPVLRRVRPVARPGRARAAPRQRALAPAGDLDGRDPGGRGDAPSPASAARAAWRSCAAAARR